MKILSIILLLMLACVVWAQGQPLIYTPIRTDVPPEIRSGRTFVPVRVISEQFGAAVQWIPANQRVVITRANQPTIELTIGSTSARVGENTVRLDAAPYISSGRTLVPLRFISESYGIPVNYDTATRTVRLTQAGRLYVLPLPDTRSGVVIETPTEGQLVRNPILVQGVANVFEGNLQIEVRDAGGRVLSRTFTTAGMGAFYPFSMEVYYNNPLDDAINGSIVVYSRNGRGDGRILAQDTVRVRLASTE
ncbi:MAG: stalk domain-containing protein [Armatimonadota bacterium]